MVVPGNGGNKHHVVHGIELLPHWYNPDAEWNNCVIEDKSKQAITVYHTRDFLD